MTNPHTVRRAKIARDNRAKIELRKANVITYLKTAWEQLGQAQQILAPKTELWNQIHLIDSDIEDMLDELNEGGYDEDSLGVPINATTK